jgi:hypothetical protein
MSRRSTGRSEAERVLHIVELLRRESSGVGIAELARDLDASQERVKSDLAVIEAAGYGVTCVGSRVRLTPPEERVRAGPSKEVASRPSPYLTTAEAAAFLRYRGASGIRTAMKRGEIRPAGRGPRGTHMFTTEELTRFVRDRARFTRSRADPRWGSEEGRQWRRSARIRRRRARAAQGHPPQTTPTHPRHPRGAAKR